MIKDTRVADVLGLIAHVGDAKAPHDPKFELLVSVVCDLMLEVEALRATVLEMQKTEHAETTGYAKHYRDTAYLAHNGAGKSSGIAKLLQLFYLPSPEKGAEATGHARSWREVLMLRRLGYDENEIREFKQDAQLAESLP